MMEWGLGLKTGAVSGLIYGVLAGIISVIYMIADKEAIIAQIQAALAGYDIPISMDQLYNISLMTTFPTIAIFGILVGIVFGIILMLLKEEWPGKNMRFKGLYLALALVIFLAIVEVFAPQNAIAGFFILRFSYLPLAPFSAAAFLFLGYSYGMFWERFGKKPKK
jgi:hypothetical protein